MSLRIWLPMTKDLKNQGLDDLDEAIVQTGCAIDNNGKLGKCFTNSGTNVSIATPISFSTSQFSICAWVKHNNFRGNWGRWIGLYGNDGEGKTRIGFGCEHTNGRSIGFHCWKIIDGTDTSIFDFYPTTITTDVWSHFVMCYDGITCNVYQNGELIGSATGKIANIECDMTKLYLFGGHPSLCSQCSLNDVRIYDHALSPMEVKELSKGLVLHFPLSNNGAGGENLAKGTNEAHSEGLNKRYTLSSVIPNGTKVTISCRIDADNVVLTGNKRIGLSIGIVKADGSGNQWFEAWIYERDLSNGSFHGRISNTSIVLGNMDSIIAYIQTLSSGTVSISQVKVEIGDHPTPWCPNSTDELYHTMGLDDGIEYDCSGFGNNGEKTTTINYSSNSARYMGSYEFNSTDRSNIYFPNEANPSEEISISLWGYKNNWNVAERLAGKAASSSGWCIGDYGSENTMFGFFLQSGSGGYNTISGFRQLSSGWHHFIITFDGYNLKYYLDGECISTKTWESKQKLQVGTGKYNIGSHTNNLYFFNGNMNDFRIYATALSADDVLSLYQASAYIDSQGNTYASSYVEG